MYFTVLIMAALQSMFLYQDREENQVGAADGWVELHDSLLQKQLL